MNCRLGMALTATVLCLAGCTPQTTDTDAARIDAPSQYTGADIQAMIERAKEKNLPYPYLYDETQKVSRAYGATVTPHIFVVGPEGTILYEGAADNRRREPNYLADALDAILAGRPVPDASTAEFGCTVKYRPEPREAQGE